MALVALADVFPHRPGMPDATPGGSLGTVLAMPRTVAEKMGVRAGGRAHFVNAPGDVVQTMGLPDLDVRRDLRGMFDHLHVFCVHAADLDATFPRLERHLRPNGALWVSWPKGRKLGSDLSLPTVIEIGYRHGLVESTTLAVDDTWSAMKFTHPKAGTTYRNSYGTLPSGDRPSC